HSEVERQIISLEKQAEKAKMYKENKERIEALEIALFVARWDHLVKKKEAVFSREEEKKKQVEEFSRALETFELGRQNGNIRLVQAQKELQTRREAVFQTRSDREIKTKDLFASDERLREMVAKEQQWRQELNDRIEKRKARQRESENTFELQKQVEEELFGLEATRKAQQEKVRDLDVEVGGIRDRQHEAQQELLQYLQSEKQIESELKQTALRIEHNRDRKSRILEHHEILSKHLEILTEDIETKKGNIGEANRHLDTRKGHFLSLEKQIEEQTQKVKETQEKLDAIYQERAEFKARQNVLLRLRDEMEGFSVGTKRLLQESANTESPLHNKVQGLYESLLPERGAEKPLSVAMKPYTQTLGVQTEEDFRAVFSFAKEHDIKDFSLICFEGLASDVSASSTESETLLSRMKESASAKHFLNNIYLVESLSEAFRLIQDSPGVEVWTNDGIYVDRRRVVYYPSEGENNVFLREAELKMLEKKLEESEVTRSGLEEELKNTIHQRAQIQSRKNELDQEIRQVEMKLVEEKYALQRLQGDLEKTKQEVEKELDEVVTLDQASAELKNDIAELNQKHVLAKAQAEEVRKLVDSLNTRLEEQLATLKVEQSDMQGKEAAYQEKIDEKRKLSHQLNVFEVKDLESLQQENRLEEEIKGIRERQSQLRLSRIEYEQQLEEIEKQLEHAQESCQRLENTVSERRKDIEKIEDEIAEKRNELKQIESEQHDLGIQCAQIDSARQALEAEHRERLHLTIEDARAKGSILEMSMEKAERKIRVLRREMEAAGDINMTSIEEFDNYKERYEFLNRQIDDLTVSKEELIQIITQLDTESRKIFKETFETIRQNFQKNFQILFKGGEADLRFTETVDILEAGIEIVAKPPGKAMRSINLLSGGEKCLTAVALLFAIFEVKPAPFCILDEIDAPLDDTSVDRFLNVVKQFTDRCQFIIITHNKRTMAIADRLYGVSMQEKGVSKLLSLEFSRDAASEPALV
ncbi:MAG: chromosome segregation protein SMC, partial [Waddliaceae bacterium]